MFDSRYRFTFFSSNPAGSTHDSTAFPSTRLAAVVDEHSDSLPSGFYIGGDEAYPCTDKLLTRWPGRNLSVCKDSFNFWVSNARIHTEQTFGILWKPLGLLVEEVSLVVSCSMKIHNFILDTTTGREEAAFHLQEDDQLRRASNDFYENFCPQDLSDTEVHLRRRRRDLEKSSVREGTTANIEELRLRRPFY